MTAAEKIKQLEETLAERNSELEVLKQEHEALKQELLIKNTKVDVPKPTDGIKVTNTTNRPYHGSKGIILPEQSGVVTLAEYQVAEGLAAINA
jgi:restriction endonuclease S subunit